MQKLMLFLYLYGLYIFLSIFCIVILHEIGHIIAGLLMGFRIESINLYYLKIVNEDGWKVYKLDKGSRIVSVVSISPKDVNSKELIILLIAGCAMNFLCGFILLFFNNQICFSISLSSFFIGLYNVLPIPGDCMSDGNRLKRVLDKKTKDLEVLDYNIAQKIIREKTLNLRGIDELIDSNIAYYAIKGYYYLSLNASLDENDREKYIEYQNKLKFDKGLEIFRIQG